MRSQRLFLVLLLLGALHLSASAEEQRIEMASGWNQMSLNVIPFDMYRAGEDRGPDLDLMFDQLRREDRHLLNLLKDEFDRRYYPDSLNEIPYWDLTRGYRIRVFEACEVVFEGDRIPADMPIDLHEGWNLIPYFPEYELPASRPDFYVLSPILEHVILANDGFGHFMSPRNRMSNMGPWRPGRSYDVQVDSACTLVYPPPLSVDPTPDLPDEFSLSSPYPNPFNTTTTISFKLSHSNHVRLAIFDPFGRQIVELLSLSNLPSGNHNLIWDAGDLPSGVYIIRLESEYASVMKRAVLIR